MTKRERAIVTAYTGVSMFYGDELGYFYKYVEEALGVPVMTHHMASKEFWGLLKKESANDFYDLCIESKTEDGDDEQLG